MMKKIFLLLIIGGAVAAVAYLVYVRGYGVQPNVSPAVTIDTPQGAKRFVWSVRSEMPTARTEVTAAVLDGNIYVMGGFDGLGRTTATVEIYDPKTDSWTTGSPLPEGRHHASAVAAGDTIFLIGGYGPAGDPKADIFALSSRDTAWKKRAPLPSPRGALAAAASQDIIFAVSGVGPEGLSSDLFLYDIPSDSWTKKYSAPIKRDHLAAGFVDGKLYVAGGRELALTKNLSTLEIYDPTSDTWKVGPAMPTARGGVVGSAFANMFAVIGGEQPAGTFKEVEAFDPVIQKWISFPPLPTARHGLSAVVADKALYVIGGGKRPGLSVSGSNEVLMFSTPD